MIKVLKLPLYDDVFYAYSTALEGNTYNLEFLYSERLNTWTFSLKDSEQNPLVVGQRLTPNTELFFNYRLPNLSGYFLFAPKATIGESETNIQRPREFYEFFYIYNDGE